MRRILLLLVVSLPLAVFAARPPLARLIGTASLGDREMSLVAVLDEFGEGRGYASIDGLGKGTVVQVLPPVAPKAAIWCVAYQPADAVGTIVVYVLDAGDGRSTFDRVWTKVYREGGWCGVPPALDSPRWIAVTRGNFQGTQPLEPPSGA